MSTPFIDQGGASHLDNLPDSLQSLRQGPIPPPTIVLEAVAREKTKFPATIFTPEVEGRLLNDWTIYYYYEYLGLEVTYRRTAQGPEVLAVGDDERLALRDRIGDEEFCTLKSWMP